MNLLLLISLITLILLELVLILLLYGSYLDVVDSPYKGTFEISAIAGATITRGADIFKFPLLNEPEGAADINQTSYSTSSLEQLDQSMLFVL